MFYLVPKSILWSFSENFLKMITKSDRVDKTRCCNIIKTFLVAGYLNECRLTPADSTERTQLSNSLRPSQQVKS